MHRQGALRLRALNHISRCTSNLKASCDFYCDVLQFRPVKRPSFDFDGYWLWGYGIGLHLLYSEDAKSSSGPLNPLADHLSFTCESLALVEQRLKERGIPFVKQVVPEDGVMVSQVFFSDPGGSGMIEVCNCDCLPIVLLDPAQAAEDADERMWDAETLCNACSAPSTAPPGSSSSSSSDGSCHA